MEQESFIISISFNPYSGHFFIDFKTEDKYLISQKVTEGQAKGLAKALGLKIING
jgi:hypothetical protein